MLGIGHRSRDIHLSDGVLDDGGGERTLSHLSNLLKETILDDGKLLVRISLGILLHVVLLRDEQGRRHIPQLWAG